MYKGKSATNAEFQKYLTDLYTCGRSVLTSDGPAMVIEAINLLDAVIAGITLIAQQNRVFDSGITESPETATACKTLVDLLQSEVAAARRRPYTGEPHLNDGDVALELSPSSISRIDLKASEIDSLLDEAAVGEYDIDLDRVVAGRYRATTLAREMTAAALVVLAETHALRPLPPALFHQWIMCRHDGGESVWALSELGEFVDSLQPAV